MLPQVKKHILLQLLMFAKTFDAQKPYKMFQKLNHVENKINNKTLLIQPRSLFFLLSPLQVGNMVHFFKVSLIISLISKFPILHTLPSNSNEQKAIQLFSVLDLEQQFSRNIFSYTIYHFSCKMSTTLGEGNNSKNDTLKITFALCIISRNQLSFCLFEGHT